MAGADTGIQGSVRTRTGNAGRKPCRSTGISPANPCSFLAHQPAHSSAWCEGLSPPSAKGYHGVDAPMHRSRRSGLAPPCVRWLVRVRGLPVLFPYAALPAIDVQVFPKAVLATG